jgi:hypothetical protein
MHTSIYVNLPIFVLDRAFPCETPDLAIMSMLDFESFTPILFLHLLSVLRLRLSIPDAHLLKEYKGGIKHSARLQARI